MYKIELISNCNQVLLVLHNKVVLKISKEEVVCSEQHLIWCLLFQDEECLRPGEATDLSFLEKLEEKVGDHAHFVTYAFTLCILSDRIPPLYLGSSSRAKYLNQSFPLVSL